MMNSDIYSRPPHKISVPLSEKKSNDSEKRPFRARYPSHKVGSPNEPRERNYDAKRSVNPSRSISSQYRDGNREFRDRHFPQDSRYVNDRPEIDTLEVGGVYPRRQDNLSSFEDVRRPQQLHGRNASLIHEDTGSLSPHPVSQGVGRPFHRSPTYPNRGSHNSHYAGGGYHEEGFDRRGERVGPRSNRDGSDALRHGGPGMDASYNTPHRVQEGSAGLRPVRAPFGGDSSSFATEQLPYAPPSPPRSDMGYGGSTSGSFRLVHGYTQPPQYGAPAAHGFYKKRDGVGNAPPTYPTMPSPVDPTLVSSSRDYNAAPFYLPGGVSDPSYYAPPADVHAMPVLIAPHTYTSPVNSALVGRVDLDPSRVGDNAAVAATSSPSYASRDIPTVASPALSRPGLLEKKAQAVPANPSSKRGSTAVGRSEEAWEEDDGWEDGDGFGEGDGSGEGGPIVHTIGIKEKADSVAPSATGGLSLPVSEAIGEARTDDYKPTVGTLGQMPVAVLSSSDDAVFETQVVAPVPAKGVVVEPFEARKVVTEGLRHSVGDTVPTDGAVVRKGISEPSIALYEGLSEGSSAPVSIPSPNSMMNVADDTNSPTHTSVTEKSEGQRWVKGSTMTAEKFGLLMDSTAVSTDGAGVSAEGGAISTVSADSAVVPVETGGTVMAAEAPVKPVVWRVSRRAAPSRFEALDRQVKGLLNKLTIEKFPTIIEKLATLEGEIRDEAELQCLVDLVVEKAVLEPDWSEMYADLCLVMNWRSPCLGEGAFQSFRVALIMKIQKEFQALPKTLELTEEQKAGLDEMAIDLYIKKTKNHILGVVKLIGELFQRKLLAYKILSEVVFDLVLTAEVPHEHFIECFLQLICTTGYFIDQMEPIKPALDQWFGRLKELQNKGYYSRRLKFVIQDVLDLRKVGWRKKIHKERAKGLSAVRGQLERENFIGGSTHAAQYGNIVVIGKPANSISSAPYAEYLEEQSRRYNTRKKNGSKT